MPSLYSSTDQLYSSTDQYYSSTDQSYSNTDQSYSSTDQSVHYSFHCKKKTIQNIKLPLRNATNVNYKQCQSWANILTLFVIWTMTNIKLPLRNARNVYFYRNIHGPHLQNMRHCNWVMKLQRTRVMAIAWQVAPRAPHNWNILQHFCSWIATNKHKPYPGSYAMIWDNDFPHMPEICTGV